MRLWKIILASVIVATIAGGAAAGRIVLALGQHTESAIAAALYPAAPLIGGTWLGAYALSTLVLVTVILSRTLRLAGRAVERSVAAIADDPAELARCLPTALHRFGAQLRNLVFAGAPQPQATLALRLSGMPAQLRGACRRLYFGLLARSQYPAALALLLVLALVRVPALLSAIDEPFPALIAAVPVILVLVALAALWVGGRLMMSIGAAPFVRALTLVPIESRETLLLRQLLDRGHAAPNWPPPPGFDEDRLRVLLDAAQQPGLRAIALLADAIKGLDRSARVDLDGIKTALTELTGATRLGDDAALGLQFRQAAEEIQAAVTALGDAIATVNELSSSLGGLTVMARPAADGADAAPIASLSLLRELELLSREMDADLPRSRGA